jgi:hypothetical protein
LVVKQKEAIRVVSHAKYRDHTNPLFKKLGILPLHDLIKYSALKFMHDFKHTCLPFSFNEFHVQAHNSPPPPLSPSMKQNCVLKICSSGLGYMGPPE